MVTIIEAVFEDGVLRPVDNYGLEDHRRYRLAVEAISEQSAQSTPALTVEIAR